MTAAATAVTVSCPACRANIETQYAVYILARAYLCSAHQAQWDSADAREHARGKGCPHAPKGCARCAS